MKQVKFVDIADIELEMVVDQDKKIKFSLRDRELGKSIEFLVEKHEVEELIYELIRLKKQL